MSRCCQISLCALLGALVACEPEPQGEGPPEGIDSIQHALSTIDCTKSNATGYKSGTPFPIVVVHVDGKPVQIDTANAYYVMAKAAAAAGVNIKVVSGFRTYAEQLYLYNCYINCNCNNCNLAAKPGYSEHNSGHALDLNTAAGGVYSWLTSNAGKYGFKRTVPSETWHWEWWGGGPGGGPCGGGDEAYYGISCLDDAGTCQSRKSYSCASGDWRTGLCPGGADVQCCTYYGVSCADGAGTCQSLKSYACASGDWRTGLCPGGTDVKCCINQPDAPDYPSLDLAAANITAVDSCKLGASAGIPDLFVGERTVVAVDLHNTGTAEATNTKVGIEAGAPHLEVRSWRILGGTGDGLVVDSSDAQPRGAPRSTFELSLGTIAPGVTKRVELTVVATAPSFDVMLGPWAASPLDASSGDQHTSDGLASPAISRELPGHPAVRAWVAHVDDYYEKAGYAIPPDKVVGYRPLDGDDLKASVELDVLGPEIPDNGIDDDCDGEVDSRPGETSMTGGCTTAPAAARPVWWPWLLVLVGALGARRRRGTSPRSRTDAGKAPRPPG